MKITEINDRGLIRLIPATYHKPPILRGLVDTDDEADILADLEGLTNARLIAEREGSPAVDRRELAFARRAQDLKAYGNNHINAAFTYTRATGNRFNSGDRGAWYCSYSLETSAAEVGFHRTRELGYIGIYEDNMRYVELLADFIGDFPDLADQPGHGALDEDPDIGYPWGQILAADLRNEGHRGLLYPSARHAGGQCFVAFDPCIVQNVRPGANWELQWKGSPEYTLRAI